MLPFSRTGRCVVVGTLIYHVYRVHAPDVLVGKPHWLISAGVMRMYVVGEFRRWKRDCGFVNCTLNMSSMLSVLSRLKRIRLLGFLALNLPLDSALAP